MRHSGYRCLPSAIGDKVVESKRPTILIIDDDPEVSQAIKRRLSRYEVEVLQAYHGTHGVWLATTQRPDVVITDLRMPQGEGQHVVEWLKADPDTRRTPIIVLTGLFDDDLEQRLWDLGVDEYFTKPVDFEDLRAAVARFVDLKKKTAF
jgi:DNA-binding response OmpR family regulator